MSCLGLRLTCKQKPKWMQIVVRNDVSRSQYEQEIARLDSENARLQAEAQHWRAVAVSPYWIRFQGNPHYRQYTWEEIAYMRKENCDNAISLLKNTMSFVLGNIQEALAQLRRIRRLEVASIENELCRAESCLEANDVNGEEWWLDP